MTVLALQQWNAQRQHRHIRSSARVEALLDLVAGRLPDAGAAFIRCILAGAK